MSSYAVRLIKLCLENKSTSIDLGSCGLTESDIEGETEFNILLARCTHLETLILSNTWIDWNVNGAVIQKLSFNRGEPNQFVSPPPALKVLTGLKTLICSGIFDWHFKDLNFFSKLVNLKTLNLSNNRICQIQGLETLTQLEKLDLNNNRISEIKSITGLNQLRHLYISDNQIKDISGIEKLIRLEHLNIFRNQIKDITPLFGFLIRDENPLAIVLKGSSKVNKWKINLNHNPLGTPPLEIVDEGTEAVIRYFRRLELEGEENVYEAKMILTGSGKSGKTSLSWRLNDRDCPLPEEDDRTREVVVSDYVFSTIDGQKFTTHIWDFGGQQVVHNFYRLFMNKNALYILLTETSRDNDDFSNWLQIIRLFGGESPILFVQNKQNGIPRRLSIQAYKAHFNIQDDLYEVNLKTSEGLDNLENAIRRHVQQLPIVQRTIPNSWFKLREHLSSQSDPFITYNRFVEICHSFNIRNEIDIEDAGGFLHQLGILLWYKDIDSLHDKIILERQWPTKALFQLIFNSTIDQIQKGYFTLSDAKKIWRDGGNGYEHQAYHLIGLMIEFKLAYRQRNNKDAYIMPALLPAVPSGKIFREEVNMTVIYQYIHIPFGIVNQLTAELCDKIADDRNTWSHGLWIMEGNTEARIIENRETRRITIDIAGVQHKELFGGIKMAMDNIHSEYKGVEYELMIPCICEHCKYSGEKYLHEYKTVIKRIESRKKETIECKISSEDVSLLMLLDNLLTPTAISQLSDIRESLKTNFAMLHSSNAAAKAKLETLCEGMSFQNTVIMRIELLTEKGQRFLAETLQKIDGILDEGRSLELLKSLDDIIEEHMNILPERFLKVWQLSNKKSADEVEIKGKLKFKIPIIPLVLDYENEYSMDFKKLAGKLRQFTF